MTDTIATSTAVGFLTDTEISDYLHRGLLILQDTWVGAGIRHASYTIRLGDRIEVARANRANIEDPRNFIMIDLNRGDDFELYPGDTAKLFSLEHFILPPDVLAFTIARGLMFSESLVPENTYADPGFVGQLYTTVTNLSHRTIKISFGDPIARIFFFQLGRSVGEPFRQGSSKGIKQRLESYRTTKIATAEECRKATTAEIADQLQHLPMGGTQIAELLSRSGRRTLQVLFFSICWPALLLFANLYQPFRDFCGAIWRNTIAVILSAVISIVVPKIYQRLQRL